MEAFQRTAAVFDVDDSLLDGNCGAIFTWYLFSYRLMKDEARRRLPRALYDYARGKLTESDMVALASRSLVGLRADELKAHARACFLQHIKKRITREGMRAVRRHLLAGHFVLMASGSPQVIIDEVGSFLHAHASLGTRAAIREGVYTEELLMPLVFREGKREHVRDVARRVGLDLMKSYVYSDSVADVPLFEEVEHATVVNPKTRFRAEARRRGWTIAKWDERWQAKEGERPEAEPADEWAGWES